MTTVPYFHDDPEYLHALVNDYLEAMGEEPIGTTNNNLLMEYGYEGMPQDEQPLDNVDP
jgi:hypothetical protein